MTNGLRSRLDESPVAGHPFFHQLFRIRKLANTATTSAHVYSFSRITLRSWSDIAPSRQWAASSSTVAVSTLTRDRPSLPTTTAAMAMQSGGMLHLQHPQHRGPEILTGQRATDHG